MAVTIGEIRDRALAAYARLGELAEQVEDEWQYAVDHQAAWRAQLVRLTESRAAETAPPEVVAAVDAAIEEIGLIGDPHRALDRLSTCPQVVVLALLARR